VLDAPKTDYASEQRVPRRTSAAPSRKLRRDFDEDFAEDFDSEGERPGVQRKGQLRLSFRGGIPRTKWGRIGLGVGVLAALGACVGAMMTVRSMVLHDDRFVIQSSSSIAVEGNQHLTKAQLLSIFGEDVERNVFTVSLAERKADLERLPWVEHATVMRLLPDHIRVSVVERTPVAFVRQGSQIGLVDKSGVLLDMAGDPQAGTHYSFPVVTGIGAEDPLSTRAARMKIYERFTSELDAEGEKISQKLSEVDLSNPEDVKALIPDTNADILVHFGDTDFLDRYHKYQAHLAEWRSQYPKLSSVDMRYDRQVVLEMQPGSAVPLAGAANTEAAAGSAAAKGTLLGGSTEAPKVASPVAGKAVAVHPAPVAAAGVKAKPHAGAKVKPRVKRGVEKRQAKKRPAGKAQVSQHPIHPPTVAH
jgi:cell division protein FtsQ